MGHWSWKPTRFHSLHLGLATKSGTQADNPCAHSIFLPRSTSAIWFTRACNTVACHLFHRTMYEGNSFLLSDPCMPLDEAGLVLICAFYPSSPRQASLPIFILPFIQPYFSIDQIICPFRLCEYRHSFFSEYLTVCQCFSHNRAFFIVPHHVNVTVGVCDAFYTLQVY